MVFPDIEIFTYKDYKGDPRGILEYRYDDIDNIVSQVLEDSRVIGQKLKELEKCKDRYDDEVFYRD